jgi:hypothetical protein
MITAIALLILPNLLAEGRWKGLRRRSRNEDMETGESQMLDGGEREITRGRRRPGNAKDGN